MSAVRKAVAVVPGRGVPGLQRYADTTGYPRLRTVCNCGAVLELEATDRLGAYDEARSKGWRAALGLCPECLPKVKALE